MIAYIVNNYNKKLKEDKLIIYHVWATWRQLRKGRTDCEFISIATFARQVVRQASEGERNTSGTWDKPDRLQAASRHITSVC